MKIHRILLPYDFSPRGKITCMWVRQFIKGLASVSVDLVHAITPDTTIVVAPPSEHIYARQKRAMKRKSQSLRALFPRKSRVTFRLMDGWPAEVIINAARALKPDLLVMMTRSRYGLSRFLKGSISEKVVRQVRCPVLVLHEPALP